MARMIMRVFFVASVLLGCQHPKAPKATFESSDEMDWDDLMTKNRLPAIPVDAPELNQLALWHRLAQPGLFAGGVYGKHGPATFYLTNAKTYREPRRLYWTKVKILSEKYACFMREKWNRAELTVFGCKDGRTVVFWDIGGKGWSGFKAKQYSARGHELYVDHGRLISATRN